MKRTISKLLFSGTFFFLLSILSAKATPYIQKFTVRPDKNGALVINPGAETKFIGDIAIYFSPDGNFNNVSVDIIYQSYDLSETLVLAGPKQYFGDAIGGARIITESINATLPANKTKGYIYLRVKATSPQANAWLSNPVKIYDSSTPPVTPPGSIEEKIRRSVAPKGTISETRPVREEAPVAVTFYLTYTITSSAGDGYFDLSSNPVADENTKVIRKEFHAYNQPKNGTVPVYRFAEKTNPQKIIYTTIRGQDEGIWEFKGIAFYAFDAESVRRTGTHLGIPGSTTPVYQIQNKNNPERTFYGIISPAIGGEWRQPGYISAAFLAYPAYSIMNGGDFLDGVFQVEVRSTRKVLDVRGSSAADGAIVQQSTWDGGLAQRWLITRLEDGDGATYKITVMHSGKALTVAGGPEAIKDGASIIQSPWVGGKHQKWKLYSAGGNYITIRMLDYALLLNVEGDASWDGAPVILWPEKVNANEQWTLYRL